LFGTRLYRPQELHVEQPLSRPLRRHNNNDVMNDVVVTYLAIFRTI